MSVGTEPVAIVGIACRFPGASDKGEFWRLLSSGGDAIREIPPARWDPAVYYSPDFDEPNKSISKWCGLVDDIDKFDSHFFGISERDAKRIDPQQRLLLEETWHCIEDSGIALRDLRSKTTSVYVGFMASDYHEYAAAPDRPVDGTSALGSYSAMLANRISYTLGFEGESVAVDAACASSLVALHEARRALQRGDSDFAIAAGVSLNFHPWKYISFSKARMLSPDGRCKTFDRAANGYVPGDGVGVLLLRPLSSAVAARNHIYGLVSGSAVNHTGRSNSITAPRVAAQRDVILAAYSDAGWNPETVTYVEAHGTGTSLGDPIEVEALTQAFRQQTTKRQYCALGSVKSNIGHLEAAAGVAGVIKVLLMMDQRRIPATLHVETLNPLIAFQETPFVVATRAREWHPAEGASLRAGVSSFGFGGANAHVLLSAYDCDRGASDGAGASAFGRDGGLFVFSARTETALRAGVKRFADFVDGRWIHRNADLPLEDVCATLAAGRESFVHRYGFHAKSIDDLRQAIAQPQILAPKGRTDARWVLRCHGLALPEDRPLADLLGASALFEPHIERLQRDLDEAGAHHDLRKAWYSQGRIAQADRAIHSFAVGAVLLSALADLGFRPSAVAPSERGLWLALAHSGMLSHRDALAALGTGMPWDRLTPRLPVVPFFDPVGHRYVMPRRVDSGYLETLRDGVRACLDGYRGALERARLLVGTQFTFKKLLAQWSEVLKGLGVTAEHLLEIDLPPSDRRAALRAVIVQSSLRRLRQRWQLSEERAAGEECLDELVDLVVDEALPPELAVALLVDGQPEVSEIADVVHGRQDRLDPQRPYRLLREHGERVAVPGITDFPRWLGEALELQASPSDPDVRTLDLAVAFDGALERTALRLWLEGVDVQWGALFPDGSYEKVPLPGYAFEGQRFWLPPTQERTNDERANRLERTFDLADPIVADHVIQGRAIVPGALLVRMALDASQRVHGRPATVLRDVLFERALPVAPSARVVFEVEPVRQRFTAQCDDAEVFRGSYAYEPAPALEPLSVSVGDGEERWERADLYRELVRRGYRYGECLQVIARAGRTGALHVFELTDTGLARGAGEGLDPALFDGILQALVLTAARRGALEEGGLLLPHGIERIELLGPLASVASGYVVAIDERELSIESYGVVANLQVHDTGGAPVLRLRGVFLRRIVPAATSVTLVRPHWERRPSKGASARRRVLALVGTEADRAAWSRALAHQDSQATVSVMDDDETAVLDVVREARRRAGDEPVDVYFLAAASLAHDPSADAFGAAEEEVARLFFHLCKALAKEGISGNLMVATKDAQVVEASDRAEGFWQGILGGIAKTLAVENPSISVRTVDFDRVDPRTCARLLAEECQASAVSSDSAYRDGTRWVRAFQPIADSASVADGAPFSDDRVYVLIGGAGGIGLHVAEHIAARSRANLVLVGRSPALDPAAQRRLDIVAGGRVLYIAADVGEPRECARIIATVKERFGAIHGVVQLSAVAEDKLIAAKTWESVRRELAPKVFGTWHLHEGTKDEPLDFFVVFSSIVSLVGNHGQVGYAAANGFLDTFVHHRTGTGASGRTLGINWTLWANGGLGRSVPVEEHFSERGLPPIGDHEALLALERLMAQTHSPQAAVLARPAEHLLAPSERPRNQGFDDMQTRTNVNGVDHREPRERLLEREIRNLVATELEASPERIDLDESFFTLGIESVVLQRVASRLEETHGPLPITVMFAHPSIRRLARHLAELTPQEHVSSVPSGGSEFAPEPAPRVPSAPPRAAPSARPLGIAVVGMSGRFPKSPDVDALWQNLIAGRDCIEEIPADRWDHRGIFDSSPQPDKTYGKWGGFIEGVDGFDPLFFNISPREAEQLDPQQRLFLETVWAAMEHAGYGDPRSYRGRAVGLFVGVMWNEYSRIGAQLTLETGQYAGPGALYWAIANRVSYWMNFTGPSLAIDTACSSSLIAVHQACMSIEHGDCDLAVAGGVNLSIHPDKYLYLAQSKFLSADGRCRSFGEGGSGYVPSEGVGAVLLKRLDDALRDGDHVYAVIRGSATNHGGRATGFTVPNPEAQSSLVVRALERAGISASQLDYVECHGTGTKLGDPIEIAALADAFRRYDVSGRTVSVGSIKSNLGHLEAAAGIAALIKVILCMQHQVIPGNLHSQVKNPNIDFGGLFEVVHEARPWRADGRRARFAGVSSFGAGGANAHVVLEAYEPHVLARRDDAEGSEDEIVLLSAKTGEQLRARVQLLSEHLRHRRDGLPRLGDLAYTLQVGRLAMDHRLAIVAGSTGELLSALDAILAGQQSPRVFQGHVSASAAPSSDTSDDEDRAYLASLAQNRKLAKIASLWVQGQAMDWEAIPRGRHSKRVALPTYPFARERYWLRKVERTPSAASPTVVAPAPAPPAENVESLFFQEHWSLVPLAPNLAADAASARRVLVIHGQDGEALAASLARRHTHARVVRAGVEDPNALKDAVVAGEASFDAVYFLGGICTEAPVDDASASFGVRQERGLFSLLRAIHVLGHGERLAPGCHLKIVTNDVCTVGGAPERPLAAGLFGLARSIAKEYPRIRVSVIDVSTDALAGDVDVATAIAAEPGHLRGREIALRHGKRFLRTMSTLPLPAPAKEPFRQHGVYLIVGGAGGLGYLASQYLAENHGARLVWVGRRPMDSEVAARAESITAAGGEVLYLQADVGDAASLRTAISRAKKQYGALHGVIHSAVVLGKRSLAETDEDAFRAGVRAKIDGSVALAAALAGEPLDFLLYFGSIASFLNNGRASTYAAGSTFLDHFAAAQSARAPYPVRLINWGYWGVGAVAEAAEDYEKEFKAIGVGTLAAAEGMEAIRRVLSQRVPQVVVVKPTLERPDELFGYEITHEGAVYPESFPSLLEGSLPRIHGTPAQVRELLSCQSSFEALEGLSKDLAYRSLHDMGAFPPVGRSDSWATVQGRMAVAPRYERLLESLMKIVESAGYVRFDKAGELSILRAPPAPAALDRIAEKLAGVAEVAAYVRLLRACYERYPRVLRGEISATDILFPEGSMQLMGPLYKGNATADYFNELVIRSVRTFIEARLRHLRPGEKIRILEVGSGTGGTSEPVLEALSGYGAQLEYFYTDISRAFVSYGQRTYGPRYPFATFRTLNLEEDPLVQGFSSAHFDIVLGANVVHATKNLRKTVRRLNGVLKSRGWLVLNEMTAVVPFLTVSAGLLDGWWLFEDEERMESSPLLSSAMWKALLEQEGFGTTIPLTHRQGDAEWTIQNVILAESDGITRTPRVHRVAEKPSVTSAPVSPPPVEARTALPNTVREERARRLSRQEIETKIVASLARTLEIERDKIDVNVPFHTVGVDSIFAVEVAKVVGDELGIELRTTALFNHPTPRALAEHIETSFTPVEERAASPVAARPAEASVPEPRVPDADAGEGEDSRRHLLVSVLAEVLSVPRDEIEACATLAECGLDAEGAVVVAARLGEALGVSVNPTELAPSKTLAQVLQQKMFASQDARPRVPPVSSEPRGLDIAVVGLSCRFPGASNFEDFWENLCAGRDAITEVPSDRWPLERFFDANPRTPNQSYSKWGGFLDGIGDFDPLFFDISPMEAELTDPQQRVFLQEAWKAFEDAGYSAAALDGARCSVFVGCKEGDYIGRFDAYVDPSYRLIGNTSSILAARLSYFLNLKGPSIPIDTACSSSLVAVHMACQSLATGASDLAVAGGVALMTTPISHIMLSKTGMLSPTGRCRTFDAAADGLTPAEGAAAVILKPLDMALRDRNQIYGVIKAIECNQDGKSNGITAPSSSSQTALEVEVYRKFGIHPESIGYVEAHGTGTKLGDPIEVNALSDAFAEFTDKKGFCAIGSVKTNVGHTLAASGVASLIKVLGCLRHRTLVPSLHFDRANSHIDFERGPFVVNTVRREWPSTNGMPRRAAISSFGMSGTNVHLVVEEAPAVVPRTGARAAFTLIPLSAKSAVSLRRKLSDLAEWLDGRGAGRDLADIGYTLAVGRTHFPLRIAFVVSDKSDLRRQLAEHLARSTEDVRSSTTPTRGDRDREALQATADRYRDGHDIDWAARYAGHEGNLIALPTYPFQNLRCWVEAPARYSFERDVPTPSAVREAEAVRVREDDTSVQSAVHCFQPHWEEAVLRPAAQVHGPVLVFGADPELRRELSASLARAIFVERSASFAALDDTRFELDPLRESDHARLLEALARRGLAPRGILYVWPLNAAPSDSGPHEPFDAVAALCRALAAGARPGTEKMRLVYAYRERGERLDALHAAFGAFGRSLRLDVPTVQLATVALDAETPARALSALLVEELTASDDVVRYRGSRREVQRFGPWAPAASAIASPFRDEGVYLLTGGLGGLGRLFAKHLARRSRARLVLCGRSPLGTEGQALLRELAALGGNATYLRADVADREDVFAAVARIEARFGALHGILHCAGVVADANLRHKNAESSAAVLQPKILGALHLDEVTRDRELDLFMLFSSISAIVGNSGQVDYAYANGFLDHFASWREGMRAAGRRHGKTISVNWPLWREGGMQISPEMSAVLRSTIGLSALESEAGLAIGESAVSAASHQLVVMPGDASRIHRTLGLAPAVARPAPARDAGDAPSERALAEQVRNLLVQAVSVVLKVPAAEVDYDASPRQYGLESINVVALVAHLNRSHGLELSPVVFFEHPSLASLGAFLGTEYREHLTSRLVPRAESSGNAHEHTAPVAARATPVREPEGASAAVAIIGVAGMLPRSNDLETFWRHLVAGENLISELPADRWDWREHDGHPNKRGIRWGGFCEDVDKFDASFFGISRREAELMDPQQRVLLQTVWKAIEDAGYKPSDLKASDTGVFVGAATSDYLDLLHEHRTEPYALTGTTHSMFANRVSYFFDLRGPSEAIDTACSSALVAIHRAAESIRSGRCALAIAGGVNAIFSRSTALSIANAGMLSPDGQCKTFDESADGYVRAEGVGVLLLKALDRALSDGDPIYALIKGSAENHGGRANSLTAPNPQAQAEVVLAAHRRAGIAPSTVTYIETHGTGTALGDPIEIKGLKLAFEALRKDHGEPPGAAPHCALGAVKTQAGHLEAAAAIPSIFKVLWAMRHRRLPGNLHLATLNPHLDLAGSPFRVVAGGGEAWEPGTDAHGRPLPRRAGISAFGFGGSNAHVVLESFDVPDEANKLDATAQAEEPQLFVLSAKNEERLRASVDALVSFLRAPPRGALPALPRIAYTLMVGREAMPARLACVARSAPELIELLSGYAKGALDAESVFTGIVDERAGRTSAALFQTAEAEGREFLRALHRARKLATLARLWVSGEAVLDGHVLFEGARVSRVPLPSYPFLRERHWVPSAAVAVAAGGLHPMLDERIASARGALFRKNLDAEAFYLRDHVVASGIILPGVGHLELARAAGELAGGRPVRVLRDVTWVKPIQIEGRSHELRIAIAPDDLGMEYQIRTEGEGPTAIYSRGRLDYDLPAGGEPAPAHLDLDAIRARCTSRIDHETFYRRYREAGFHYGPSFRVNQEIVRNRRESLGRLVLPEHLRSEFSRFGLHPSLLDASLQAITGIERDGEADGPSLSVPFALGRLEVVGPLPPVCFAYATLARDGGGSRAVFKYDVTIVDEKGAVLVRIHEFSARAFKKRRGDASVETNGKSLTYYRTNWIPDSL